MKRIFCGLLSALLLVMCPMVSYADATATVAWTAGRYAFSLLLNACGIDVGLSGMSAWLGQWSGMDDYNVQGATGKLGSFSQYLYNLSHNAATEAARERALADQQNLNDLMMTGWAGTLDTGGLLDTLKGWLGTMGAYGTDSLNYNFISVPGLDENTVDMSDYTGDLSSKTFGFQVVYKTTINMYYFDVPVSDVFLVHAGGGTNADGTIDSYQVTFNVRTVDPLTGYCSSKLVSATLVTASYSNGRLSFNTFRVDKSTWYANSTKDNIVNVIKSIPFPVFDSYSDAKDFINAKEYDNAYNQSAIKLPVVRVFPSAQKASITTQDPVITLPDSASAAESALKDVTSATNLDTLKQALIDAGLAIDWVPSTDIPTESETDITGGDTSSVVAKLSDILAGIQAIPDKIGQWFEDKSEGEALEDGINGLSLPSVVADKFPFCIPFDVAYLVETLNGEAVAPKFEIPIKFDYQSFHYDRVFIVDMSDYDSVVRIFRVMMDLLFAAGLIVITRDLIRG